MAPRTNAFDNESWSYSSPDGNVLLSGRLLGPDLVEGVEFELEVDGIQIEHHSLVTITTSSTGSQTLHSLNSGSPLFTLAPNASNPRIINLHLPLLTPSALSSLRLSPLFSTNFNILLDGPDFAPPRFDPMMIPSTPAFGPTITGNRSVLSPLLTPRRTSIGLPGGSDLLAPSPFSLGGNSRSTSVSSVLNLTASAQTGLGKLLPPNSSVPLTTLAQQELGKSLQVTAEQILQLRKDQEAFARRLKLEVEVLEARANAGVGGGGQGVVVRGFGEKVVQREGGDDGERSASRERTSIERVEQEDEMPLEERARGRGRARAQTIGSEQDEELSRRMSEQDKLQVDADARNRSKSRQRKEDEKKRNEVKQRQLVERTEAIALSKQVDEEKEEFRPSSSALISIPEAGVLALPKAENGSRTQEKPEREVTRVDHEDEDGLFEMDEDIDDFSLANATSPYLAPTTFESETRALAPQQSQAQSFRSSSYRPTSLASAYDTLLATSLSRASPLAHFTPPPTSSFSSTPKTPSLGYLSRTPDTGSRHDAMGTTPREDARVRNEFVDPPDRRAAREEELKLRDVLAMDVPSHRTPLSSRRRVASQEESEEEEQEEEDDRVEELPQASRFAIGSLPMNIMQPPPSKILALSSSFRPEPELDLTRKTSVPGTKKERLGLGSSYINPATVVKAKNIIEEEKVEPKIELDMTRKEIGARNEVRSELGMSLRNGNGNGALLMSQGREALDEGDEEEKKSEDEEEEEEEYVPPHMWAAKNIKPEDLLSRSVSM